MIVGKRSNTLFTLETAVCHAIRQPLDAVLAQPGVEGGGGGCVTIPRCLIISEDALLYDFTVDSCAVIHDILQQCVCHD